MESSSLESSSLPKSGAYKDDPSGATLISSLNCGSTLDFIRSCFDVLTKALHITVTFTYERTPKAQRKSFFLLEEMPKHVYGSPLNTVAGQDVRMLLKNMRGHWRLYSDKMNVYYDVLDDITGFLLYDIYESGFNPSPCVSEVKINPQLYEHKWAKDCIEASIELLAAISEAKYYQPISKQVGICLESLNGLFKNIDLCKKIHDSVALVRSQPVDTQSVLQFLQNDGLLEAIQREESEDNPKIISNFFHTRVLPFVSLVCLTDSGVDLGLSPDKSAMPDESNTIYLDVSYGREVESLVIIDPVVAEAMVASTPKVVNKNLDRIKDLDADHQSKVNNSTSLSPKLSQNGDRMDGSFIVL